LSGKEVRVYFDRTRDPIRNLAREDELFAGVDGRKLPELVRFWIDSECLVRGKARSASYGWYNETLAEKMKIKVIDRATGGGVVYHDEGNLNWSFFLKSAGRLVSPERMFGQASGYMTRALASLGVNAEFAPPNRIDVQGRKISGMAARSTPKAYLVHGTLLLRADLDKLNKLCIPPKGCPPVANLDEWVPEVQPLQVVRAVAEELKNSGFDVRLG
jgi:lipoate---protein ligase